MSLDQVQKDEETAAFLAEMAEPIASDEKSPQMHEPEVTQDANAEAVGEPAASEQVTQDTQEALPQFVTKQELSDALAEISTLKKAIETTNGTYGARLAEQQKVIDEFKARRGTLTAEKMKRISEEFGEDLAEMLAQDLNEYITQDAPDFNAEPIRQEITSLRQFIAEKELAAETKALTRAHSDWKEIATYHTLPDGAIVWNNPKFAAFVGTLPADEQRALVDVVDADFISAKLTDFKASIKPSVVNKQNINAAVLPKGVAGKVIDSELSEEEAAFRAEMRRN